MKIEIEITEQNLKDLREVRNYFGEHDKTLFEHKAYAVVDSLVKKLNIPAVSNSAKPTWKDEWRVCSGFEHHKKLLTDNHMINIKIRKDGKWHEIEADWLKRLVRQEFLGKE